MIKILFLAANPLDTNPLRLGEEAREIKERIQLSDLRNEFVFEQEHAVRVADLQRHLLHHQPHIVHFSGHGSTSGKIILENVQGRALNLARPRSRISSRFSKITFAVSFSTRATLTRRELGLPSQSNVSSEWGEQSTTARRLRSRPASIKGWATAGVFRRHSILVEFKSTFRDCQARISQR